MRRRDIFDLLILGAIWGASFLFQRMASPEFGPVPLVLLRVAIAALLLLGACIARGEAAALRQHWRALVVVGTINSAIPFGLFAYATLTVSAGLAAVLNGTAPLFAALIGAAWFRERLDATRIIGLIGGFAGVVVLVWRDIGQASALHGIAAGLLASVCYGTAVHIIKQRLANVPPFAVAAGSQVAAAAVLLIPAVWSWPVATPSATAWACALALGAVCTGLAYALFFRLVRSVGATRSVTVAYLIPVFGMVWGNLFLGESITATMIVGCAGILGGVALITRARATTPVPAKAEPRAA